MIVSYPSGGNIAIPQNNYRSGSWLPSWASSGYFLHCDFIIGAEDCKFGEVEDRLGLAGLTLSPIWVLRCGLTHALDMCITGRIDRWKEAARINLINWAVPAEKLEENVIIWLKAV